MLEKISKLETENEALKIKLVKPEMQDQSYQFPSARGSQTVNQQDTLETLWNNKEHVFTIFENVE